MENKNMTKKKSNPLAALIKDALALFVITLVSGLALSFIYEITKEPIATQKLLKEEEASQKVFSDAVTFEDDEELMEKIREAGDLEELDPIYKGITIDSVRKDYDEDHNLLGYNIGVSTTNGYKDVISLMIGYSLDGTIKGIAITSINETPGLGMLVTGKEFINQYIGKEVSRFVVTTKGASSEEEIDAITMATISTDAVTNAINSAIDIIQRFATDLGGGQSE